jgi:hypothetical protein
VVGLYLDPPAHSLVLSVDEKSQIQALDRTQPGLPMKKGRAGTMTHTIIFSTAQPHRSRRSMSSTGRLLASAWHAIDTRNSLGFPNRIEAMVPLANSSRSYLDNYASR